MSLSDPVAIWVVIGLVLMLAELVIPGGIVVFIGLACLITAGALFLGLISGFASTITLWAITTIVLLLAFRNVAQKLVGGDTSVANTDEDMDIYGKTAKVLETIGPGEKQGRVEFQDTSWLAIADGTVIEAGEDVTIVCRDNIALVVEKPTHNSG